MNSKSKRCPKPAYENIVKPCLLDPFELNYEAMEKAKIKKSGWVSWSEDEVKLLKKLFPRGKAREIADQIGRPLTAVRQKAYSMGLKTRECHRWSANEVELLKKLYPNENTRSMANKLGRSMGAVMKKASSLSLKNVRRPTPWSRQEENLLKKLYPGNTVREIASQIGRSASAVAGRAHKLELRKARRYPVWSKKELNMLKKLYPSRTAQQIAEQIGRPVQATRLRIVKLGLKKKFRYEESHRVVSGVKQKRCSGCKQWKAENMFYRARCRKDRLAVWCKECAYKANKRFHKKRRLAVRD